MFKFIFMGKVFFINDRCSTNLRYIYVLRSHLTKLNIFPHQYSCGFFYLGNLLTCEFVVLGPTLAAFENRVRQPIFCLFSSVSSLFESFFLQNWPVWYTNECTDGATNTRKHAQIQDMCTWAGKKGAVVFPVSPPNLFMVVKMVGGLRLIKIIWKVSREIKAVPRTKRKRKRQKKKRRHLWHISTQLSFSSISVVSRLVPNMS